MQRYVGGVISILISAVAVRFGTRHGFTRSGAVIWLAIGSLVGSTVLGGLLVLGLYLQLPSRFFAWPSLTGSGGQDFWSS